MGLFDFFRSKNKTADTNKSERPTIEPNEQGEFTLKLSDFDTKIHTVEVISVKVSADFYDLFPEAGKPTEGPGKREIKTSVVNIVFGEKLVELTFNPGVVSGDLDKFIAKINDQLNWLIKNKAMVDEVIIRDLLSLKNDSWLDENEAALSGEQLLAAISPISINFDEKAGISLHYDDGDMFGEHTIVVEINSKRKVKSASIAG